MQPTFLPWGGYFRLLRSADKFVFLDNVQLARQSWQTRNRILVGDRIHWVTVPIQHASLDQRIDETRLSDGARWRKKTSRVLAQSYARHPYKSDLDHLIVAIENGSEETLSELNMALVMKAMVKLKIFTPVQRASQMALASEDRTDKLIEIGHKLGCTIYLSPLGSAEYLAADRFVERTSIKLEYANEGPPPYKQRGNAEFVSHMSIVDIVANLGWEGTAEYIGGEWHGESNLQLQDNNLVRPMTAMDLPLVLQWRNHWDVRPFMYTQHEIPPDEHLRWFEKAEQDPNRHLLIFEKNQTPMGYVSFRVIRPSENAHWGFYCAPEAPKGTGRLLAWTAVQYAFSQLRLRKICGQVLAYNESSVRLHLALGFKQEGVLRHQHFDGQNYHDVVCFGLLADEWRPEN